MGLGAPSAEHVPSDGPKRKPRKLTLRPLPSMVQQGRGAAPVLVTSLQQEDPANCAKRFEHQGALSSTTPRTERTRQKLPKAAPK